MSTAPTKRLQPAPPAPAVLVAEELEIVERRLAALLGSREETLSEISRYLIGAGGKRVRPAVTLLVFRACGGEDLSDIVDVAVALELIHSASLLHDDIIDGSSARRGRDSALLKYGVANTLVAGDFLFSRAFQICGRFDEKLIHWAAEACVRLTEGEVMQGRFRRNPAVTLDDYMEIIKRKTASLFETGARTAARLAGAREEVVESMARCGLHVGMAFQMIDDLLDVTGSASQMGKPVGIDLREGNPSLPIVRSLADGEVRRLFAKAELSEPEFAALLARVRRSDLAGCRRLAVDRAAAARTELDALPDSAYRESLIALAEQLVERAS